MSHDTSKQSVLFGDLSKKAVIAKFDQDHASSDGCRAQKSHPCC